MKKLSPKKKYPRELADAIYQLNSQVIRDPSAKEIEVLREEVRKLRIKYERYD